MFKLKFFIYFKKYLIVIKEKMNDIKIDKIFNIENSISCEFDKFFIPKIDTAAKVGMDNKKEIFAESNRLKPNNLAALIVIPERLTPGINARI